MNRFMATLAAASVLTLVASGAHAITVDGVIGAGEYAGAITTIVPFGMDDGAHSSTSAYTVYFTSTATTVNVAIQTNPDAGHDSGPPFANLYFSTVPGSPSNVGFEATNLRSFIPGVMGYFISPPGEQAVIVEGANASQPSTFEFAIPWAFFQTDPQGLGFSLVGPGGGVQLRVSQSFGYSFVSTNTDERFGAVYLAVVPEPGAWAVMLLGFGAVGAMLRHRKTAFA